MSNLNVPELVPGVILENSQVGGSAPPPPGVTDPHAPLGSPPYQQAEGKLPVNTVKRA